MAFVHQTVLKDEAVAVLAPSVGKVIVDGTLGGGGHSEALLERGARVIGIDRDPVALAAARGRLGGHGARFEVRAGNFGDVERLLAGETVDGLLLDLGVSSPQLDTAERGFSFQANGPLDMRMGAEGETAAELIRRLPEAELADLLYRLGDEPFSRSIARELKRAQPSTTAEAAEAVGRAVPRAKWPTRIHVATRTFQALRMAVNGELEALGAALEALPRVLKPGGRAAIISFHSLEDRMVKERFRELEGRCACPPGFPVCGCGQRGSFRPLSRKAVVATEEELERNPRARSAHLRAVEKVP